MPHAAYLRLSLCRENHSLHKPRYNRPHTDLFCAVTTGDCLLDVPESAMPLPKELPGSKYSVDQQCQQIFGEEFVHCPNTSDSDICIQLWCQEEGTLECSTKKSLPWADGTPCSANGSCLHGVCMPVYEAMKPLVSPSLFPCFLKDTLLSYIWWQ